MKKIFILASALLLSLSTTSCLKELDNPQHGVVDLETYYANAGVTEAEQLIAAIYKQYFTIKDIGNGIFLDILSDDCSNGGGTWTSNSNKYRNGDEFNNTPDDWPFNNKTSVFITSYKIIYESNLLIDKVKDNSAEVARIKAEAMYLRAAALFELIRWYGNPPFADHIYGADDMLAPNGNPDEEIEWIIKNLDESVANLPALPGKGRQEEIGGRVTKTAAQAMAGKVSLWYGTYANKPELIKKATGYFKTVIDSGLYDLLPDVKDVQMKAADFSCEYIFERNNADVVANATMQADNRHTWRSLRSDNVYIPKIVYPYGWSYSIPSPEFIAFAIAHDGKDSPRFKAKILSFEDLLAMEYEPDSDGNIKKGIVPGRFQPDCIGYFSAMGLMLGSELYPDTGNSFWSMANVPILRYADILVMYAEAQYLDNNDADGSGLKALNKVRERAGIAPLTSMTYQDIKDERRMEMWAEQERFMDLKRWHEEEKYLTNTAKIRYEFRGYKEGTTEYDIRQSEGPGKGWQEKYKAFPYTTAQLQANPNLKQNPGW